MPLIHSNSDAAFKQNTKTLMNEVGKSPHVKSRAQALAIAYDTKRRAKRAMGGPPPAPWYTRAEAHNIAHTGPIMSAVPGRTDNHAMAVPSGSYVVPAETVSHLGQSNTTAGMRVLNNMFGHTGPYGAGATMGITRGAGAPRPPRGLGLSDKGGARGEGTGEPVDVMTAGGEYVIPPEVVTRIGGGDLAHGHRILDKWIMSKRQEHIRTLKTLKPPAKS